MHLHCGFSVARLLKGLSNTLSFYSHGREAGFVILGGFSIITFETIRLKSLPTFECSALQKQVNMITAVWVVFFFEGAIYTPETNMCPKKGPFQKKRLVVSNHYFSGDVR